MSILLHRMLADLAVQVRSVQLHPYEGGNLPELAETLALRLGKALGECLTAFSAVKGNAPEGSSLERICALVVSDLRARADHLVALGGGSPSEVAERWLAPAAETLDALESGLWAVNAELLAGRGGDEEEVAALHPEAEPSLGLRRAYAKLRRHVRQARGRHPRRLEPFLRSVGTALVRFAGRDEASSMPLADRLRLLTLRDRILAWLRGESGALEEGLLLRREVVLAVEGLARLNRRPELIHHDRRQVAELVRMLSLEPVHGSVPVGAVPGLQALLGRADSLDDLILAGADVSTLLRELLHQLLALEDGRGRWRPAVRGSRGRSGLPSAAAGKGADSDAEGRAA